MNKVGIRVTFAGALAQVLGLGIDAWLHISDPTLAAREALLTFSNAGHVLLIGGIALVLVGVGIISVGPLLARAAAPVRIGVPVVLALVLGGAGVAAANSSLSRGHDHGTQVTEGQDHGHGDGTEPSPRPMDGETRDQLAEQLRDARDVAAKFPTVADAERAGYRAVTTYLPLIGAHYIRFVVVDGTFRIEEPEMLLYDGTKSSSRIVGLSYFVQDEKEPAGFAGLNDHWHRHLGLCLGAESGAPFVVGGEDTSEEECRRRGGQKADGSDGWMVHAWVVPGWESAQGVFSAENTQLM